MRRPREHLDALRAYETVVTPAYTGRHMRGRAHAAPRGADARADAAAVPGAARGVGAKRGPLYMGGTGARRARELPVAELVRMLVAEAELDSLGLGDRDVTP